MGRHHLTVWVLVGGCWSSGPPPEPPLPPLVNPLAEARSEAWVQETWFVAKPGERLASLDLSAGGTPFPVVALVAPDGTRRALRLEAPGVYVEVPVQGRPEGARKRSQSSPDGALRVQIDGAEQTVVTVTDARNGKRTEVVRDIAGRDLGNPSIDAAGSAVYFDADGNLGGIFHVDLALGQPVRIVPDRDAGRPVAWREGGTGRIVYAEEGDRLRIVVARPPGNFPIRPARDMVSEGRLPNGLVPVVLTLDDRPLRITGCDPVEPLNFVTSTGDVRLMDTDIAHGRYCGRRCTELVGTSPEGAPRVLATLSEDPLTLVWNTTFDPTFELANTTWIEPAKAVNATEVKDCLPDEAVPTWVYEPMMRLEAPDRFVHATVITDVLVGYGFHGRLQPAALKLARGKYENFRNVMNPTRPPAPVALSPDGDAKAEVVGNNLVITEVSTGVTSVRLEGGTTRKLRDPAYAGGQASVLVVDQGPEAPGLLRVGLRDGQVENLLPVSGIHHPQLVTWAGRERIALVREIGTDSELATLVPLDEVGRAAWREGVVTLTHQAPVWIPTHIENGQPVRCQSEETIRFWVDEAGGYLQWGAKRVPLRAAAWDGSVLSLLAVSDVPGVALLVAEMRLEGRAAHFWPVGIGVAPSDLRWRPEAEAASLPLGGPCRPRG